MSTTPGRFREARFYVGAGTVAMLLGLWSALTVHDIQARNDQGLVSDTTVITTTTPVDSVPATTQRSASGSAEQPATTTTTRPTPHTRTRAS